MAMHNPVGWFEIYVADMQRAESFYQSVFGTAFTDLEDPTKSMHMRAFSEGDMQSYGATGALVKMEGVPVGQNSVMVYFSCDDCAVEEAKITPAGGKVIRSKFSIGSYGFVALAQDTEGNIFGLHSSK